MFNLYKKLYSLLTTTERHKAALICVLLLLAAISETVGVASIMPFIAVLSNPEVINSNPYLSFAYQTLGFSTHQSFLLFLGASFLGVLIISLTIKVIGIWGQLRFSQMRCYAWSSRLFEGYLRQPYEWFLGRHSAHLANTVLGEVRQVVNGALFPAMNNIAQCFITILLLGLLIIVDPLLALAVGGVLGGTYAILSFTLAKYVNRIGKEQRIAQKQRHHVAQESLGGIKDIKVAGLESVMLNKFKSPAYLWATRQIESGVVSQIPQFVMQGFLFGGMLLVLLYLIATYGGFQEALPIVALYAFAGYRLMPALQGIYSNLSTMRFHEAMVDSLIADLTSVGWSETNMAETSNNTDEAIGVKSSLELRNISYTYPNASEPTLQDISIHVPALSSIALVGSTGAGKTTLVDIVLGLLSPSSGTLLVDGQEVSSKQIRAWQQSIGYVPQQIFLADDTIAANIAFGIPHHKIDMEQVKSSAKAANLHSFIENQLTQGYETPIGERGARLSGGQQQRLGIARALYHNPDVLILDEATSALDNLTEQVVMDAVNNLGNQKTIILIAHRLSTVRNCDCIYVLEHGKLIEAGPYAELLESSPRFRALAETA